MATAPTVGPEVGRLAREIIERCVTLSGCSDDPGGRITRTFLSPRMRDVHAHLTRWMTEAGMQVRVDAVGNIRGLYPGTTADARRLYIASHLDTVPDAGAFDGVLGVVTGVALVRMMAGRRLPIAIEVIGFSEEEGVRFALPFIGSRALVGSLDAAMLARADAHGVRLIDAIRAYGLDPDTLPDAEAPDDTVGYLEVHIEQGPILDSLGVPLGVVEAIVGQMRLEMTFTGSATHAGTTPMVLRRDALAAAAEWIVAVEQGALAVPGLLATVGQIDAHPGATNVVAGTCIATLDIRHEDQRTLRAAGERLVASASEIGRRRRVDVSSVLHVDQPSVQMDSRLTTLLAEAVAATGVPVHRMFSGAGHDAMVVAQRIPAAMLFLRSPGGISHHPDERVHESDVALALAAASRVIDAVARYSGDSPSDGAQR